MTKLAEWMAGGSAALAVWLALVTGRLGGGWAKEHGQLVLYSPVLLALLFAVYAGCVVLYRTLTFNDCGAAADDLRQEIEAARKDLRLKGYAF